MPAMSPNSISLVVLLSNLVVIGAFFHVSKCVSSVPSFLNPPLCSDIGSAPSKVTHQPFFRVPTRRGTRFASRYRDVRALKMSIEDGMELDGDIVDSLYDPTEDTPDKIDLDDLLEEKPKKKKRKGETNQRETTQKTATTTSHC